MGDRPGRGRSPLTLTRPVVNPTEGVSQMIKVTAHEATGLIEDARWGTSVSSRRRVNPHEAAAGHLPTGQSVPDLALHPRFYGDGRVDRHVRRNRLGVP